MLDKIYRLAPHFIQNLMVWAYNKKAYAKRYGGKYWQYRKEIKRNRNLSLIELKDYQRNRYRKLIEFSIENSTFYRETLNHIKDVADIDNIADLPIVNKETLRENIDKAIVDTAENLEVSKTGGTSGKSLIVKNFKENIQERFAFLDDFRSRFGYELGKKTAWFSGKNILTKRDLNKNRFWKTDNINKVRYYSTFHIKKDYLKYYIENIINYQPEYLVGFPSTMLEIAKYGNMNGYNFPVNTVKAIFPTAETITISSRKEIEKFFKSKIYNQYASSEGAPFIFECHKGNLHLELQSGVFEVLNDNNEPSKEGKLVLTSFINEGTPLIRYDIGDSLVLEADGITCSCGNNNPLVKEILGRVDDYIYSPQTGKINLGNISNTLKGAKGIVRFQVQQDKLEELNVLIIIDKKIYNSKIEQIFLNNWRDRVGEKMKININYVENIPVEASGKFRIVKNNIKDLL